MVQPHLSLHYKQYSSTIHGWFVSLKAFYIEIWQIRSEIKKKEIYILSRQTSYYVKV